MKPTSLTCIAIAALSVGALHAPVAWAHEESSATGVCQGNLPASETQLRKRPLALANEGTASAFVSCSLPVNFTGPNFAFTVTLINRRSATATVNCTFVDGEIAELGDTPSYRPKSIALDEGAGVLEWLAPDFGLSFFTSHANLSCLLPPGVEIATVGSRN